MVLTKTKKIISLPRLMAKAQRCFNAWIRRRDADKSCITCGKYKIEHACHFYPTNGYPALRFDSNNCHGGCLQCNYYRHGSLNLYRQHLEQRIGKDKLALLDSTATRHGIKKFSRLELEIIIQTYKQAA